MNRTAREIRRAFENITPNVLDRVLSQSSLKKGAVTPMQEKKPFIPYAIQKIASAAAVVVLLVAIGAVALMILNGRTNPQLSDNPTEPPTEAPTEPPTEAPVDIDLENLKLNATKLDKDGNEIGTTQITIHVTKGEDDKITDIQIDPFDGWKGLALPVDSTTGEKFEIQQITENVTESVNIATLGGFKNDNRYYFCTLFFTDDFEQIVFVMPTNISYEVDHHYYVAAAGNNLTVEKILAHFEGITIIPTRVEIPEGPASQEKAIAYMKLHVKNPDRYELIDYTYQEHTDKYEAMFVYRVYGISTSDYCRVVMCSDGTLDHCSAPNEGIFDNIQITPEMLQSADERLYNMYYGLSKDSYTIEDMRIIMDAGVVSVEYVLDPPEPATFLETYAVPLIQGEVVYDEETALAWAKKYFGVGEARLFLDVKCELSDDKNFVHYDVSFRVNGYRYSCEVGRFTGEVWNAERVRAERWDSNSDVPPPISAELATKFVFEFLNIDQTQVKELKVELITNDDAPHYKITFLHNGKEYEWEIDVDTGGWQFRTQN